MLPLLLRRATAVALLGFVLVVVGGGSRALGGADGGGVQARADGTVLVREAPGVAPTSHASDRGVPCAVRADCAGGWVLAGVAVIVALPAVAWTMRRGSLVTAVAHPADRPPGLLLAGRLFRPPRPS